MLENVDLKCLEKSKMYYVFELYLSTNNQKKIGVAVRLKD